MKKIPPDENFPPQTYLSAAGWTKNCTKVGSFWSIHKKRKATQLSEIPFFRWFWENLVVLFANSGDIHGFFRLDI